jgi:hypothetical protein
MFPLRKITSLLLLGLSLIGCGKRDRSMHDPAINPSIAGVWSGTVKIAGVNTAVAITLQQNGALVKGNYTADGASPVLARSGSITGATTGPSFSLDVNGNAPACLNTLKIGGENDGAALSFNLIGSDCHGAALNGESFLTKSS